MSAVESAFAIVAEPHRRAILSLLLSSERSVGEIERKLRLSQPSVSKHLRVLREAGFVESRIEAQRRLYRLRPEPLMELDAWLVPFRRFWSKHLDALEQHLEKMEKVPSVKGKKKTSAAVSNTRPVPLLALRFEKTETSGRSFSSATSPTIPKTFGRRSRTPSISANGLHSILTGTSVALAPQSSQQWGRRRRMYPRPR